MVHTLKPRVTVLSGRTPVIQPGSWRNGKTSANDRGYTYAWQQARAAFLARHPLCQCDDCMEGVKRVRASTVVDHHIPHHGDRNLFWDRSNWRAMAKDCHDAKTAREDGGFGNPVGVGRKVGT